MKKFLITTLFLGAVAMALCAPPAKAQVSVSVTIGGFYYELAPYGRWIDCRYGQYWVPARVSAHWQPYSNGQWVYTEYGWTWMSNVSQPGGGTPPEGGRERRRTTENSLSPHCRCAFALERRPAPL